MKIIAECGCNWHSLKEAKIMIEKAKEVGCWAVKFQLFTEKEAPELPENLYLSYGGTEWLFEQGEKIGIPVFFTPMYLEAVDWCEDIGVSMYKIRYKDNKNSRLMEKIALTKKPTFISINKYPEDWVRWYLDLKQPYLLYCIPKYPADFWDYKIPQNFWKIYNGISDHTPNLELLKEAQKVGVEYFEKHIKLNEDCIEAKWSVTFESLKKILDRD